MLGRPALQNLRRGPPRRRVLTRVRVAPVRMPLPFPPTRRPRARRADLVVLQAPELAPSLLRDRTSAQEPMRGQQRALDETVDGLRRHGPPLVRRHPRTLRRAPGRRRPRRRGHEMAVIGHRGRVHPLGGHRSARRARRHAADRILRIGLGKARIPQRDPRRSTGPSGARPWALGGLSRSSHDFGAWQALSVSLLAVVAAARACGRDSPRTVAHRLQDALGHALSALDPQEQGLHQQGLIGADDGVEPRAFGLEIDGWRPHRRPSLRPAGARRGRRALEDDPS